MIVTEQMNDDIQKKVFRSWKPITAVKKKQSTTENFPPDFLLYEQ